MLRRILSFLFIFAVSAQSWHNLTVVGLRPYNISGLDDKDTADSQGDVYFWMVDKVLMPYTCEQDPTFMLCKSEAVVHENNVYEVSVLSVDYSSIGRYALCNADSKDPTGGTWECYPSEPQFGIGNVSQMFGHCRHSWFSHHSCSTDWVKWRAEMANKLPEMWFSSQKAGHCDVGSSCYWNLETKAVKNATCVNSKVEAAVESKGASCFNSCGAVRNVTSDCYIKCFFNTILGGSNSSGSSMTVAEIMDPFNQALSLEDVSKGGCPSLPPHPGK